jgi:hypothetical protein
MSSAPSRMREVGTALAVLAIYLLTILAPLHQARASQLAFQDLGYSTIESGWVLCSSTESGQQDRDVSIAKCPAAGIGKPAAVAPTLDVVSLNLGAIFVAAPLTVAVATVTPFAIAPPAGPRAPPALV